MRWHLHRTGPESTVNEALNDVGAVETALHEL
jgi:hypothetical protein